MKYCHVPVQPRIVARSSSAVLIGMMLNLSTSTSSTGGVTNAGNLGPSRTFLMPRCSSVNRIATAFCSYQLTISDNGRSLTPQSNAPASAEAILIADQEEVPDLSVLDRLDHFIRDAQHGVVPEAHQNRLLRRILGKARSGQSGFDHRREILVRTDVRDDRPGDQTAGKDPILVIILGLLDAVGRHQDRAREL